MTLAQKSESTETGIALLALLLTLALMGIALMGAVEWYSVERQRESEVELLYAGDQYRKAIERYYNATPGAAKELPHSVDDLLEDHRFPMPIRHLRRPYHDPLSGGNFELLYLGSQFIGVSSTSTRKTLKRGGFKAPYTTFEGLESYDQWKFVYLPHLKAKARLNSQPSPPVPGIKTTGAQL